MNNKSERRQKIRYRIRKKIEGSGNSPRLSVFRSNKEIYAQLINDLDGKTLAAASSNEKELKKAKGTKSDLAKNVGKLIGERAKKAGFEIVVFDRSGYLYHGRVKALAEGAREAGLKF